MADIKIPKLLLPAGNPECFEAALAAGADEIYIGGKNFNARMGADNFDEAQIAEAVSRAHFFDVSVYVTMNTLLLDREMSEALAFAGFLYKNDVDGLIVADTGFADALKKRFPDLRLHASTQCAAHNSAGAKLLALRGFERVVLARECSADDINKIISAYPGVEYEMFVHGALCVCTSGMCEYSANMGGRSGNRGECAQPCRLPDNDGRYRLSLKDNCLASHIKEIIESGVTSLKIEGRMKSPEYVYGVGRIYRKLLDEQRDATEEELNELSCIFSRGGFTDGYYTGKVDGSMLGVRSEYDKEATRSKEEELKKELSKDTKRATVSLMADIRAGKPCMLTLSAKGQSVTVYGEIPQAALTSPLLKEDVVKNLCKFGSTPFKVDPAALSLTLDSGISLPVSAINSLRRTACERLLAKISTVKHPGRTLGVYADKPKEHKKNTDGCFTVVHFVRAAGMPGQRLSQFSHVYLPIDEYLNAPMTVRDMTDGVELPPVVMQHEYTLLEEMLIRVKLCGVKHVMVSNVGTLKIAKKYGFEVHGGLYLNVYNSKTADVYAKEGLTSVLLSPELNAAQMKGISGSSDIPVGAAFYGKLPVMVLEKCIIKDITGTKDPDKKCDACSDGKFRYFKDRTGEEVPVCRQFIHRNVIYNPVPVYMADKQDAFAGGALRELHFFFTDETPEQVTEIIEAYKNKLPSNKKIKRI